MTEIQTRSGLVFDVFSPQPEKVLIADVASALSKLCRFNGHCIRFYSVAEHCWHVSHAVERRYALQGLLHDASEAYLSDVPGPVKPFIEKYVWLEDMVSSAVYAANSVRPTMESDACVKHADSALLVKEMTDNMSECERAWDHPVAAYTGPLYYWEPRLAELKYLERYYELRAT